MGIHNRLGTITLGVSLLLSSASAQLKPGQGQHPLPTGYSGIAWAMQAMAALTGGSQVNSVSETGSVVRINGDDREAGSITLQSTGIMTNQITISTSAGNRSETRSWDSGMPSGEWTGLDGQPHQMGQQNCWTDAVWFFPALSLLSDYADPNLVFTDLGQIQYNGGSAEHIRVYRSLTNLAPGEQQVVQRLSTVDYYLDSQSALPVAIAFSIHGDRGVRFDVHLGIVFSQYQSVSGIQIPFTVTELLNGSPFLQITITSVATNGLSSPAHQ